MGSDDPGYHAVQAIDEVGRVFAAVFVTEIGDVSDEPGEVVEQESSNEPIRWRLNVTPNVTLPAQAEPARF